MTQATDSTTIGSQQITLREWRWALAWSAAVLAITCAPYLLGAALSSPERVFGGFVLGVEDGYSYLAKMGEGARGAWLFHIVYTSEPHDGALFFLFHILLGKIAALLAGLGRWPLTETMAVVYHAARLVFGMLLMMTVYRFVALFTGSRAVRRLAFLIVALSGGLGWLLLLMGQPNWLNSSPIDLILPEGFTFLVLYGFPHIAAGRTLLLLGFILLWKEKLEPPRIEERKEYANGDWASFVSWRSKFLWAGVCWLAMGLIVPFYVAVAWAVAGAAWLAVTLKRKAIHWGETWQTAGACLISAPIVVYSLIVFTQNPVMRTWSEQNLIRSPHPLHYVAGYALVGGLAILGAARVYAGQVAHRNDERQLRLLAWAVIVPPLLYLPFNLQRRLIEGWQIPQAILAAIGLVYKVMPAWRRTRLVRWLIRFPRYTVRGLRQWVLTLILLALLPTNLLLLGSGLMTVASGNAPIFHAGGQVRALDWLDARATYDDVVLSSYEAGNYLPARVGARAFIGLGTETAHIEDKRALMLRFFAASTSDEWRAQFLREHRITYVLVTPQESLDPSALLLSVYQADGYAIYRVVQR